MSEHDDVHRGVPPVHRSHAWEDASQVRSYMQSAVERDRERLPQLELLSRLLPFDAADTFRFLDLGGGHGNLSRIVLERYPNSTSVLLDASGPMLEAAATYLAEFTGRVSFVRGSFAEGLVSGPFGAIISSLAIHHLATAAEEARLYRSAFESLEPGGCFLNLDLVAPPTEGLERVYNRVDQTWLKPYFTSPRTDVRTVGAHIAALRDSGFSDVDCFWKSLHEALYGGFKAASEN